jgi:hypothetical protein
MPARCTFPDDFVQDALDRFDNVPPRFWWFSVIASCCFFMSNPTCETRTPPRLSAFRRAKYNDGGGAGPAAIFPSTICLGVGANRLFPPLDQALVHAMACEGVAETEEPLSRQSLADLVRRSQTTLGKKISRSTVWRMLHEAAIKPWQKPRRMARMVVIGQPVMICRAAITRRCETGPHSRETGA